MDFASVPLSAGAPPSPSTVQRPAHAAPSPASVARRPDARAIADARGLFVSAGEQLATIGPGEPLEPATRVRMERAFGYSLSPVRVHRGEPGAALATAAGARALAVGEHVAFAAGEYRPGTPAGDALLAHELAHSLTPYEIQSALGSPEARAPSRLFEPLNEQWIYAAHGLTFHVDAATHAPGRVYGYPAMTVEQFEQSDLFFAEAHEVPH